MECEKILKDSKPHWVNCTLCRTHAQSSSVLKKATERKVEWPRPKPVDDNPIEDPTVYTSIDDAFATLMQYMSTTTRQCKRYYRSCSSGRLTVADDSHCHRFHTPTYTNIHRHNPLESAEDVHMVVHPGTYAVTAGEWGTARQQTHLVHVANGQSVNVDFVM